MVERVNGFLETSFLPGRDFASPGTSTPSCAGWLPRANARLVRRTGGRPGRADRPATRRRCWRCRRSRPPTGFAVRVRLPRDYYVRVARQRLLRAPAGDRHGSLTSPQTWRRSASASTGVRRRATQRSLGQRGLTITDPDHVEAARTLRKAFQNPVTRPETADAGCGTWPTTTARSVSTARHDRAGRVMAEATRKTAEPDRVLLPGR